MYDWTNWVDQVNDPDDTFTITDLGNGTSRIHKAGTVMTVGTPQDQDHFNKMERGILDAEITAGLLMIFARQIGWQTADLEKWAASYETGVVEFTSTTAFPLTILSRPSQTIALTQRRPNSDYVVLTDIVSFKGNVGDILVYDKLDNGFKLSFTGSATYVKVKYTVFGGPYT